MLVFASGALWCSRAKILQRNWSRGWSRYCLAFVLACCLMLPAGVFAHTIAEVVADPAAFDQQTVQLAGHVTNMVTHYGENPYTTFDLVDVDGTVLPIFTWGHSACRQEDFCRVIGTFMLEASLGTRVLTKGIKAEEITRVAGAEYKTPGPLFHKKRSRTEGLDNRHLRDFFLP